MKKTNKSQPDDRVPEYNLESKKGVRRKYAKGMQDEYSVRVFNEDGTVTIKDAVLLDPDVKAYFPDSESVNHALRALIELIPEKKASQVAEDQHRHGRK